MTLGNHDPMPARSRDRSLRLRADLPPQPGTWALYLAACGLLAFYYLSFYRYGVNIWDEGGYAYGSWRTLNGQTAMKDFNPIGYLPGRYEFGALLFRIFGVSLENLRLGMVALTPIMVLMVYALARRLMPAGFALLAGAMMASAPSMHYNRFFPLFCVLNLYCLVRCVERPGAVRRAILAGAILLTVPFKPEVALFSALVSCVVLGLYGGEAPRRRPASPPGVLWLARGALLLAGLALLVYLVQNEVPQKFYEIVTATRRVWGNPLPGLIPSAEEWSQGGWHVLFERILFYAPPLVYGLALLRWLAIGDDRKSAATLLAMTGFGICAYGLVLWRSGFDNLLRTLPSFYILLCFFLHRLWLRVVPEESGPDFHRDRMRVFKTLPQRWLILAFPLIFLFEINSHHGYYAGSIGAAFQETRPLRLNRLGAFTNPVEARWLRDIVDRIQRFSVKEDRILALPLNPIFYFLSERENAINHDWILPGMLDDAAQQNVVDQLRARPPAVVILADFPIDGREERRFSRYAPIIHRFIRDHYALYDTIGLFEVLLPRRMEEETPHTQAPPAENPADASHPPSDNTGMPQ